MSKMYYTMRHITKHEKGLNKMTDFKITSMWHADDILSLNDTLSEEQCIDVLKLGEKYHDANVGYNWDYWEATIETYLAIVERENFFANCNNKAFYKIKESLEKGK